MHTTEHPDNLQLSLKQSSDSHGVHAGKDLQSSLMEASEVELLKDQLKRLKAQMVSSNAAQEEELLRCQQVNADLYKCSCNSLLLMIQGQHKLQDPANLQYR